MSAADDTAGPRYPAGWGFFAGKVTSPDGMPLAEVRLDDGRKDDNDRGPLTNLDDGTFRLAVPKGHRTLKLSRAGYADVTVVADIEPGETDYFDVVMKPL